MWRPAAQCFQHNFGILNVSLASGQWGFSAQQWTYVPSLLLTLGTVSVLSLCHLFFLFWVERMLFGGSILGWL